MNQRILLTIKTYLYFLSFLTLSLCATAQNKDSLYEKNTADFSKKSSSIHYQNTDRFSQPAVRSVIPNTIVVKLKTQYRDAFEHSEKYEQLHGYLTTIHCYHKERIFPLAKSPSEKLDIYGRELVDLSLLHIIKYNGATATDIIAAQLMRTGLFEYAEAKYSYLPNYIPNDSLVQPDSLSYIFLKRMKAFDAWTLEKGDPSVIIGIVDVGADVTHPDLVNKYVPGYDVSDLDTDVSNVTEPHGTGVASCAAAETDNVIGMAGTGYNCRFMPVKAAPDAAPNSIDSGYEVLVYAADNGCSIINLSWGGAGGYSSYEQGLVNYCAINKDVVITASAGNTNAELDFYPASYDNVLSVAACDTFKRTTDTIDVRAPWATYSTYVDICAQGRLYMIAGPPSVPYYTGVGSSFSSPIVAGAAGLIRAKYGNQLNALQVCELLRVTADNIDSTIQMAPYAERVGKGRLNMYRAITDITTPAVRTTKFQTKSKYGSAIFNLDTITVNCDFWNYLRTTSNLYITISSPSPDFVAVDSIIHIGVLDSMTGINNAAHPFKFYLKSTADTNQLLYIRVGYYDTLKSYYDYQYFKFRINPTYVDIDTNKLTVTITSKGTIGFNDGYNNVQGDGIQFNNNGNACYESALMIATSSTKVSSCARAINPAYPNNDFRPVHPVRYVGSAIKDQETRSSFNDSLAATPIGITIEQRSYAWKNAPNDQYVIIEYLITNNNTDTIPTLYVGLFSDWDIGNYTKNKADYDYPNKLGYAYNSVIPNEFFGVSLLTNNPPSCYSMDNSTVGGNNINPNGGFSPLLKYKTLSQGIGRPQAGVLVSGNDISQVIGGTLYNIAPSETATIAFAIVAGSSLAEIQSAAANALVKFKKIKTAANPLVTTTYICNNDITDVQITATDGNKFNFYNDISLSSLLLKGKTYSISPLLVKDTIFATNADSLYESPAIPIVIDPSNKSSANFSYAPGATNLSASSLVYFVSQSNNYDSLIWNFGDGHTLHDTSSSVQHHYFIPGTYTIELITKSNTLCSDTISKTIVVKGNEGVKIYPNPASTYIDVEVYLKQQGSFSLTMVNNLGQEVLSMKDITLTTEPLQIDVSNLAGGIYHVRIVSDHGTFSSKFLKTGK